MKYLKNAIIFLQMTFRFDRYAISVRAGRPIPIEECRNYKNEADWKQLCIEGKRNHHFTVAI